MTSSSIGRILVVDDEPELAEALRDNLLRHHYEVVTTTSPEEAVVLAGKTDFDVLLSDLMMPVMDGIVLLRKILEIDPQLVGIIMTGQATVETAVEAMKTGAFDYLLKPFKLQHLLAVLHRAMEVRGLRLENIRLRHAVAHLAYESKRYQIIGSSPSIKRLLELMEKVAPTDSTVLISGATGTGKELVARAIHHNSLRRTQQMVTINCAAIQENLLESELFGHEKGSFTGAGQTKQGLIEVAEKGTLFIDEVAEMSPSMQAKLLRVLEDGHFRRVGGTTEYHADVRVIAATNKNLEVEQKEGRFRSDVFYRLNVVNLQLPMLRERPEDIPLLVDHLLTTRQLGKIKCRIEAEAMRSLKQYHWPGNIRELANVLERAQILAEDHLITLDDLPENLIGKFQASTSIEKGDDQHPDFLETVERRHVQEVLKKWNNNKVQAAQALGISRRALYRLIDKYLLEKNDHSISEKETA